MDPLYKPELKELSQNQQESVDKYSLVVDTDVGRMLVEHLQTTLINDQLFGDAKLDLNDQYFRGMLNGMSVFYDYLHSRAEVMRNPTLDP